MSTRFPAELFSSVFEFIRRGQEFFVFSPLDEKLTVAAELYKIPRYDAGELRSDRFLLKTHLRTTTSRRFSCVFRQLPPD